MRIGVSVPLDEIGQDLGAVREYVAAAERLGYGHVRVIDHVLGAHPEFHRGKIPVFHHTHQSCQHEPLTLLAYLAGLTSRLELVIGVLVLPQRQTALVAK